ncbi:Uncharacterised protein [Prevotella pallens]|uniref:Uncharacterized protein n=1 Tax=Prevotella pallens TaxID=60133 RepID=A0A379EY94_9BACT|nr:Uncharacterised protein [Prevotella pallens]
MNSIYLFERQLPDRATPLRTVPNTLCRTKGLYEKKICSHPLKTIFQHKACTDKLYADSFYKVQKNSHSSFEVICCRS